LFDNVTFNLKSLSDPAYVHKYFVDGPLAEGDAYIGGAWKNYLVGSTGAGAKSIFALDITAPGSLGTSSVKWEKNSGDTGYADLGKVLGHAAVVRLRDGSWAAIFGNGYDSTNSNSVLFLVNIATGSVIKTITVGTTSGGLSTPALLFNKQRELIGAYAGDLQGNLWKFDLSGTASTAWTGSKLFTATNGTQAQPVTQKPVIQVHPDGGYLIIIGTGKFYETADKTNAEVQSLYGIWDKPAATAAVTGRSVLVQQTLTAVTGGRTLTTNMIDWTTKFGWYIDLVGSGERVVGDMSVESNLILFATTFAPTTSICDGGGTSQFMGVNFLTGGASSALVFKNSDGTDMVSGTTALSSVTVGGTATNPVGINIGNGNRIMKFNKIDGTQQDQKLNISQGPFRSWHQLTIQ
jgi:type IV pilus assembly protein PilY1